MYCIDKDSTGLFSVISGPDEGCSSALQFQGQGLQHRGTRVHTASLTVIY